MARSTLQWSLRHLRQRGLYRVNDRDQGGSYYQMDLPDPWRRRVGLPSHEVEELRELEEPQGDAEGERDTPGLLQDASDDWAQANLGGAEDTEEPPKEPAWDDAPKARGVLGKLVDVAKGIASAASAMVTPGRGEDGGHRHVPYPSPRPFYVGRQNVEPPPLNADVRRAIQRQYARDGDAPRPVALGAADIFRDVKPKPSQPVRHVGALYRSRDDAADAAEAPPRYDGPGDEAPHRRAWAAYRTAYRRDMGRDPPMGSRDHWALGKLVGKYGVDRVCRFAEERRWAEGKGVWEWWWSVGR
jgi:hypothetical protein